MFASKFTLFILLLQWVPSLLMPLLQEDASTLDNIPTIDPDVGKIDENVPTKVEKSRVGNAKVTPSDINDRILTEVNAAIEAITEVNNKEDDKNTKTKLKTPNDNDTPVNINDDSEFPKAGLPVFRSLIPLTQLRQQLPISLILPKNYQMIPRENLATDNSPIDGLFGNAFNFIRRLKRDSEQVEKKNCSSINNDENCKPKTMKKIKIDLSSESARKAFEDIFNINKVGHSHEETSSTELSCPISVFLKVMYEDISKQLTSDGSVIPKNVAAILNSISKGDNDSLRLVNKELSEVPFPTKVKVQLENGDENNFLKELSDYVDTTLCSVTK